MKNFLFILIGLFITQSNYAQLRKTKNTYVVNVNAPGQTIRAEVLDEKPKIKPNEKLSYFWYASNKIVETKGGYDGKLLHGQYSAFYFGSNLKEKGEFKNGIKNDKWMFWYENGNIKEITTWKNGLKSGPYKTFNEAGELTLETNYKKGQLNGSQTKYLAGKIVSQQKFKNDQEILLQEKVKDIKSPRDTSLIRKEAERKAADKKATLEKNKLAKELELKKKADKKKAEEEAKKKKSTGKTRSNY